MKITKFWRSIRMAAVSYTHILTAEDRGDHYMVSTGTVDVQIDKSPFRLTYWDKNGQLLCEGGEQSMGWSTDGEILVQNKKQADERFWGLGCLLYTSRCV